MFWGSRRGSEKCFQIVQRKARQVCCLLLLRSLDIYTMEEAGKSWGIKSDGFLRLSLYNFCDSFIFMRDRKVDLL